MDNIQEMFEPFTKRMQELEVEKLRIEETVRTSNQQVNEIMQLYEEKRLKLCNLYSENASLMRLLELSTSANTKLANRSQKSYETLQRVIQVFKDTGAIMQLRLECLKELESSTKKLEEDLIKYNDETERERKENQHQIDCCMKEIDNFKQESEDNAKRFEKTMKEKNDQINAKKNHINELLETLQDEENINKTLTDKRDVIVKETESLVSELSQLKIDHKEMIAKNDNELTELNNKISTLTIKDKDNKHLLNKLKAEKETLITGLEKRNTLLKSIEMENIKLKEKSDNLDIKIDNRKTDIDKLELQIQQNYEKFDNEIVKNNCQTLEEENAVLTKDVENYKENIAAWEIMIFDSNNQLEKDKSYAEELESELNKMHKNMQDDKTTFLTTINELKAKLQQQEMLQNDIAEKQNKLKSEMEAFEKEIGALETNSNTIEKQFADEEIAMNLHLDKLKNNKQMLKSQIAGNKNALKKIEADSKKKKAAALMKRNSVLEEKAKQFEEKIKLLESERQNKKKENDEVLKTLANQNTTQEQQIAELKISIDNISREINVQEQQLEASKSMRSMKSMKLPENKMPVSKLSTSSYSDISDISSTSIETRARHKMICGERQRPTIYDRRILFPLFGFEFESSSSSGLISPPLSTQQSSDDVRNALPDEKTSSLPKPAKKIKRGGRRKKF